MTRRYQQPPHVEDPPFETRRGEAGSRSHQPSREDSANASHFPGCAAPASRRFHYDGILFVCGAPLASLPPVCPARKPQPQNVAYRPPSAMPATAMPLKTLADHGRTAGPGMVGRVLDRVKRPPRPDDRRRPHRVGLSPHRCVALPDEFRHDLPSIPPSPRWACPRRPAPRPQLHVALEHGYESNSGFRDASRDIRRHSGPQQAARHRPSGWKARSARWSRGTDQAFVYWSSPTAEPSTSRRPRCGSGSKRRCPRAKRTWSASPRLPNTSTAAAIASPSHWSPPHRIPGKGLGCLRAIPHGRTCSYQQLAVQIGRPDAQRAVGKANGDNRIAILIPCHRVIRGDGTLCGYGGGLWRKQFLLDLESGIRSLF